jgi:hypothetical protein
MPACRRAACAAAAPCAPPGAGGAVEAARGRSTLQAHCGVGCTPLSAGCAPLHMAATWHRGGLRQRSQTRAPRTHLCCQALHLARAAKQALQGRRGGRLHTTGTHQTRRSVRRLSPRARLPRQHPHGHRLCGPASKPLVPRACCSSSSCSSTAAPSSSSSSSSSVTRWNTNRISSSSAAPSAASDSPSLRPSLGRKLQGVCVCVCVCAREWGRRGLKNEGCKRDRSVPAWPVSSGMQPAHADEHARAPRTVRCAACRPGTRSGCAAGCQRTWPACQSRCRSHPR